MQIVEALATAGEYEARIELPTHGIVDCSWAAHEAGRRLGIRVAVDIQITTEPSTDRVAQIRVTPLRPPG